MVGGPLVYFLLDWLLPQSAWWRSQLATGEAAADAMAMLHALIAMGLTTALWVVVALMTKPESEATLTSFYRRARPMGWWAPVRRMVEAGEGRPHAGATTSLLPVEPRFLLIGGVAVAVVGAAWVAAGVLGVSQLTVGNWSVAGQLLVAAVVGALAFRYLFDWHMKRVEAD